MSVADASAMTAAGLGGWLGLPPIAEVQGPALAAAAAIIVAVALVAALVARLVQATLRRWWERARPRGAPESAGEAGQADQAEPAGDSGGPPPPGPLASRAGLIAGMLAAMLLLSLARVAHGWPAWSALALAVATAMAAGLTVRAILRGLGLGPVSSLALGLVAMLIAGSRMTGGWQPVADALDQLGLNVGRTRLSLLTLVQAAIAGVILFALVRIANRIVARLTRSSRRLDEAQALLVQKIAGVATLIAAFFVGIDLLGIDLTAFAVFSGAFGLAVGFGLQKTFGNLIAGIILLMDRSVKPGDVIVVGDSFGKVSRIGVRAVSVVTREGKEHLIPNELLMTERVENWSYSSRDVRVSVPVGVDYDSDLGVVRRLLMEAATGSPRVLDRPAPVVWLRAFGESAVEFEIRFWINDPEEGVGNVQSEVLGRVWDLFKAEGIVIPFARRDVRILMDAPTPAPVSDAAAP